MEHLASPVFRHCGMYIVACKRSVRKGHSNNTSDHGRSIQDLPRSDQIAGPVHYHAIRKVSIILKPGYKIHHLVELL